MSLKLLNNIRRQCADKGISIAEIERRAGLADNAIFKWACTSPSVDRVQRVAAELGVSMDELLGSEENG